MVFAEQSWLTLQHWRCCRRSLNNSCIWKYHNAPTVYTINVNLLILTQKKAAFYIGFSTVSIVKCCIKLQSRLTLRLNQLIYFDSIKTSLLYSVAHHHKAAFLHIGLAWNYVNCINS